MSLSPLRIPIAANPDERFCFYFFKLLSFIYLAVNKVRGIKLSNYGIKTGYNEAFIIDEDTKNNLIKEDPNSKEIIKPLIRGRDIQKYHYNFMNLWLINSHNGLKNKGIPHLNGHGRGDEYIKAKVVIPKHLNQKQRDLLKEFAELSGEEINPEKKGFFRKVKDAFG